MPPGAPWPRLADPVTRPGPPGPRAWGRPPGPGHARPGRDVMRGSSTHPRRAAGLAGLLLALTLTGLAHAQTAPPPAPAPAAPAVRLPEPLTREAVRELVSRLSDTEVRQLLLAQLDRTATASAPAPGDAPLMGMVAGMEGH